MPKINIEVFESGTTIVFLYKNRLMRGQIQNYKIYTQDALKYSITTFVNKGRDLVTIDDVDAEFVFETKDEYIEYIKNLEI